MCSHVEGRNHSAANQLYVWQMECVRKTQTLVASAPRNCAADSARDLAVRRDNPSQLADLLLPFWVGVTES